MSDDYTQFKADYEIASRPDVQFTTWYDPDRDWLTLEARDKATGALVSAVGCRMEMAVPLQVPEQIGDNDDTAG